MCVCIYIVILIYCNNVWPYKYREYVSLLCIRPYYIILVIDFRQTPIIPTPPERFNYPRFGWVGKRWLRKRQVLSRNHIKTFRLKNSSFIFVCMCMYVSRRTPKFFFSFVQQPVRKSYTNLRPLCLRFAKPVKGVRHRRSYIRSSHTRRPWRWLF